jgi:D-proline reductase (dithiol) PrdB
MPVDSFKYLPRIIATFYETSDCQPELPIPWTPLRRPLTESKFGLVTSGGLFHKGVEPPFDLKRERQEPTWGDPTFRTIPVNISQEQIGVSHLHVNPECPEIDINILLPIQRFQELAAEGRIASLAGNAYSFMGYQGYPPDTTAWRETYAPQVAEKFKVEGVDCVLLTPS